MFPFPAGDLSRSRPGGTKKGKGRNLSLFVASPRLEREFRVRKPCIYLTYKSDIQQIVN